MKLAVCLILLSSSCLGCILDDLRDDVDKLIQGNKEKEVRGTWHLGMNINPDDGHIFGYTEGK